MTNQEVKMTNQEVYRQFRATISNRNDAPAIRESFSIYVDNLARDGLITEEQAQNELFIHM